MFIFQEWTLREQLVLMTPKCDFISKFKKKINNFVYTLRSALLVPLYFHFAGSRAGLLMPIILYYMYVYIFSDGGWIRRGRFRPRAGFA